VDSVATIKGAILFGLHTRGVLFFVLGRRVILALALSALELDDFPVLSHWISPLKRKRL
jgi:hypothetical protein